MTTRFWTVAVLLVPVCAGAAVVPRMDYSSDVTRTMIARSIVARQYSTWDLGWRFYSGATNVPLSLAGATSVTFSYAPKTSPTWREDVTGSLENSGTNGQALVRLEAADLNTNGTFAFELRVATSTTVLAYAFGELNLLAMVGAGQTNALPVGTYTNGAVAVYQSGQWGVVYPGASNTVLLSVGAGLTPQFAVLPVGTAAYSNAGAFASAAQGALADTALQPASTSGWVVSSHDAWITAPTATGIAQAVVAPYTNGAVLGETAVQPADDWTSTILGMAAATVTNWVTQGYIAGTNWLASAAAGITSGMVDNWNSAYSAGTNWLASVAWGITADHTNDWTQAGITADAALPKTGGEMHPDAVISFADGPTEIALDTITTYSFDITAGGGDPLVPWKIFSLNGDLLFMSEHILDTGYRLLPPPTEGVRDILWSTGDGSGLTNITAAQVGAISNNPAGIRAAGGLTNANVVAVTTVSGVTQTFALAESTVAWKWTPATNVTLYPTFTGPASGYAAGGLVDLVGTNCSVSWPSGQVFLTGGTRSTNVPAIALHTRFLIDWFDGAATIGIISTNGAATP